MAVAETDYIDVIDSDHNASSQVHDNRNHDLALDKKHDHHHAHLHHSLNAEKGLGDQVAYSKDTAFERSTIPHQTPHDHELYRRAQGDNFKEPSEIIDPETGRLSPGYAEEDPQSHGLSSFYSRYRTFFHLLVWLVFTGLALIRFLPSPSVCPLFC